MLPIRANRIVTIQYDYRERNRHVPVPLFMHKPGTNLWNRSRAVFTDCRTDRALKSVLMVSFTEESLIFAVNNLQKQDMNF